MSNTIPVFLIGLSLLFGSTCEGSRILVVPVDGSHWINMEVILRELHSRGHDITVLHSPKSWYISTNSSFYTSITRRMMEDEVDRNFYNKILFDFMNCRKSTQFLRTFCQSRRVGTMLERGHAVLADAAAEMLDDRAFIKSLQDAKFDLMLTDPALTIGVLLGSYLKLPMVYNVRWTNTGEAHFTIAPSPLSYVPMSGSELHDQMDFLERTKNMLHYLQSFVLKRFYIDPLYSDLLQRHYPPGSDLLSLERSADLWLVRSDFVFEFPRPTMPNVVYIGGFQCKEAKPLPADLEAFMQSSGEHGVVVMSLGTLVSALSRDVTEAIAAAFAQLPQKVVWKFLGEKPSSLGNNTLLVKWLPQNDLLGHPKTRAFIAHGGTNGMYEAIYHGVPVVGIPLFFDQFDNVLRLEVRGAARVVEAGTLTEEGFLEALKDVLETPSYRQNIQQLSELHRDVPTSPMDTTIFWIEYVIRHKGAVHLQSQAFSLPWYSYFCLDVALLFMVLIGAFVWTSVTFCRILFCRKSGGKRRAEYAGTFSELCGEKLKNLSSLKHQNYSK
ncbi:UDP glucuronosyltransferase 5 family, polypeptide G1 [Cheilinus undulatus]|uniref:UDP glucuronosyltransferase 5 family, polypeptide G1 n=1 Tax=Cheilinus undulatus TaxID=241271 RepID=UPI001BD3B34E|nr:UDP glucuronosyltransferase 5 family, polypeptide G1 [Cheilinus undulatus]